MRKLHIIIAEDDDDDQWIVGQSFRGNTHYSRIDLLSNGLQLVEFLRNEDNPLPDAILTDINMPLLDGIQALQQIAADPRLQHIPTFVYSTSINPVYEAKCRELGIRGYLVKPYEIAEYDLIPTQILKKLESGS
jgi:CheY-like chemotaxis protein